DLEFIPNESEEDKLHRLHLQMESMWKINRFPDEINLDSINDKEQKLWEKSLIVVDIDSIGGSDAGNSFSRVQVMYPIRRIGGWIRAASFKFGIGVQSRKVLEWDPKAEKLKISVPMEFKMQAYNRKGKQIFVAELSFETGSGFSDEIRVEKLMLAIGDGNAVIPDMVCNSANNSVTFSEALTNASLPSGNDVSSDMACNSVIFSEASTNASLPSGNAVFSNMACNSADNSVTFLKLQPMLACHLAMLFLLIWHAILRTILLPFLRFQSMLACHLAMWLFLIWHTFLRTSGFLSDASSSFGGFPPALPLVSCLEHEGLVDLVLKSVDSASTGSCPSKLTGDNNLDMELGLDLGPKALSDSLIFSNMDMDSDNIEESEKPIEHGKSVLHVAPKEDNKGFLGSSFVVPGSDADHTAESGDLSATDHEDERGVFGEGGYGFSCCGTYSGSCYKDHFLKEDSYGFILVSSLGSSLNPAFANVGAACVLCRSAAGNIIQATFKACSPLQAEFPVAELTCKLLKLNSPEGAVIQGDNSTVVAAMKEVLTSVDWKCTPILKVFEMVLPPLIFHFAVK
ncbi:hypothetical protein IFM89_021849, partial [Coptis chinensis]